MSNNSYCQMETVGKQIRELRRRNKFTLSRVSKELRIDPSVLSKIERGERNASRKLIIELATLFNVDQEELLLNYYSDKVVYEIMKETYANKILKVAEKKLQYMSGNINE